jgi:hypothetical protein
MSKTQSIASRFVEWALRGDGPTPSGRVEFQIDSPEEFAALEHVALNCQIDVQQLDEALRDGDKRKRLLAGMKNNPRREMNLHESWHIPLGRDKEGRPIELSQEEERER